MIYLDYASHTPICEEALEELIRVERSLTGNALSFHSFGEQAQLEIRNASEKIASVMDVCPEEIIFTSGASESNNLAIKGIAKAKIHKGRHILSTCLEHASVQGSLQYLSGLGFEVELLALGKNGQIALPGLERAIRGDTVLICINAIDGELGIIQPLKEIYSVLEKHPHVSVHIDASQAMGKHEVAIHGASTLSFAPHKFYGPLGVGVLYKKSGVVLEPLVHGKGTSLYRGGTPAPALAAACSKALCLAHWGMAGNLSHVQTLHAYAAKKLTQIPKVQINSPKNPSPYILNFGISGIKARKAQQLFNEMGVALSTKSACSSDNAPSRAVYAVTGDRRRAASSLRLGFGVGNTFGEIDRLVECARYIAGLNGIQ